MDMKTTTYGQKGGEGPTRGRKIAVYDVILPTDEIVEKRTFCPPEGEACGYGYQHQGQWFVAAIDAPGSKRFAHYTSMPATRIK
jgi:hypothetical protein